MKTNGDKKADYELCNTTEVQAVEDDGLESALDEIGTMGPWLWMVFFLASTPGIFNCWHLTAYVFIGGDVPHWCSIEELEKANWSQEQIRNVSIPGDPAKSSCVAYAWNYTQLAELGYDAALEVTSNPPYPSTYQCQDFSYGGSGIVSEWDLVCGRTALRTTVQMAVALGKFIGALAFGFIADKYGRKRAFVISCIVYMSSGIVSSFTGIYIVFVLSRIALGMAGSGTYNCAFTLLTEVCHAKHRTLLGNLYNLSYPLGMVSLPVIAYYLQDDWQMLQLALSIPSLILIVHCFLLPESPRWLISQGRRDDAWVVVKKASKGRLAPKPLSLSAAETEKMVAFKDVSEEVVPEEPKLSLAARFAESMSKLTSLFRTPEMRKRTLICYYAWCVTALTYYALSLSADNFSANRYIYVAIAGGVEAVSYLMPVPILKVIGRRLCCALLYFMSAAALLSILAVPEGDPTIVMSVAMVGRLCIGSVYSVIILYTTELFPTENRNTAVGTSSTMSNVGSMAAPYVVDLLGAVAWYIPSTLCGVVALLAGLLVLLLPETKDKKMCDTVEQTLANKDDRVSLKNCCICH